MTATAGRRYLQPGAAAVSDGQPVPRGYSVRRAAQYVGVSVWTMRDYVIQGLIQVIDLPALRPKAGDRQRASLRRVVIDREDLDRFIESRKRHEAQRR